MKQRRLNHEEIIRYTIEKLLGEEEQVAIKKGLKTLLAEVGKIKIGGKSKEIITKPGK